METIGRPKSAPKITSNPTAALAPVESYVPFGLILLAFVAVTLWLAAKLNLYIDELYSLHTTSYGFGYALEHSLGFEQQPPLFFLALTAWRSIDESDYFARLFSIGCSLITLFIVWRFGRRHFQTLPNWLTPLVFAVNPFFIWVALDIRVYAMAVSICALLLSLFFDVFESERVAPIKIAALTLVAIAGIYTQYFIGSMLIAFGLALAACGRPRKLIPYGASMLVVAVALVPLLLGSVGRELREETAIHVTAPLVLATHMLGSTLSFAYPHTWVTDVSKTFNVIYAAIVLCTIAYVLRERRNAALAPALAIIVASMVAFFLVIILAIQAPLEMPRHIAALFVPTILFALASFAGIQNATSRRRISFAYLACLLLFSAADDAKTYRLPLSNSGDWQRVGDFLNANVEPSEPIVVFDTEDVLGVRHYYRGAGRIVPLPHEQNFAVFDRRDFSLNSADKLAKVFPVPAAGNGRVWLVFGISACTMIEVGNSCSLLDSFVSEHFDIIKKSEFNGTTVEELQAKRERGALEEITTRRARLA